MVSILEIASAIFIVFQASHLNFDQNETRAPDRSLIVKSDDPAELALFYLIFAAVTGMGTEIAACAPLGVRTLDVPLPSPRESILQLYRRAKDRPNHLSPTSTQLKTIQPPSIRRKRMPKRTAALMSL